MWRKVHYIGDSEPESEAKPCAKHFGRASLQGIDRIIDDKREKPLFLDMAPGKAFAGFLQIDPDELKNGSTRKSRCRSGGKVSIGIVD